MSGWPSRWDRFVGMRWPNHTGIYQAAYVGFVWTKIDALPNSTLAEFEDMVDELLRRWRKRRETKSHYRLFKFMGRRMDKLTDECKRALTFKSFRSVRDTLVHTGEKSRIGFWTWPSLLLHKLTICPGTSTIITPIAPIRQLSPTWRTSEAIRNLRVKKMRGMSVFFC